MAGNELGNVVFSAGIVFMLFVLCKRCCAVCRMMLLMDALLSANALPYNLLHFLIILHNSL